MRGIRALGLSKEANLKAPSLTGPDRPAMSDDSESENMDVEAEAEVEVEEEEEEEEELDPVAAALEFKAKGNAAFKQGACGVAAPRKRRRQARAWIWLRVRAGLLPGRPRLSAGRARGLGAALQATGARPSSTTPRPASWTPRNRARSHTHPRRHRRGRPQCKCGSRPARSRRRTYFGNRGVCRMKVGEWKAALKDSISSTEADAARVARAQLCARHVRS